MAGLSERRAYEWLRRFRAGGEGAACTSNPFPSDGVGLAFRAPALEICGMAKSRTKGKAASTSRSLGTTYDGVKVLKPKTKPTHFTSQQIRAAIRTLQAKDKGGNIFVEPRPQGDFAVKRAKAKRASDVLPTQAEAVARAHELEPEKSPLVKRVRNTKSGSRGQWRKA